jgi:zinc protease
MKRTPFLHAAVILSALASFPERAANAQGLPFKIQVEKLENGLSVVMVQYPSPGLISFNTMVRVGSRDEVEKGVTGFAHFFEHMMFRGTKNNPPEKVTAYLKKTGADQNGFTTDDFTCYTFFGRNDWLEELVAIEADRFMNLEYTEDAFKTESQAVLGEYNKSASSPELPLEEKLREETFKKHTYGHTTLGYLKDIQDMPKQYEYSRKFFKRFYTPDNSTIVAVGDFDPAQLMVMIKKHYAPWNTKRETAKVTAEPPQKKEIRAKIDWKTATLPLLSLTWRTPATNYDSPETAAYGIMNELLFGKTSAIYTELVLEKQLVESFGDWSWNHRDPYFLHMVATVKDPASLGAVETRVDQAVAEIVAGKLDPKTLEDVKSKVRYGLLLGLDSPEKIAGVLFFTMGPTGQTDGLERYIQSIEKLTAKDVQSFAKKYLTKNNRSVLTLVSKEGK